MRRTDREIADHWLQHYRLNYPSAVGVLVMNTEGNTVAQHHIHPL